MLEAVGDVDLGSVLTLPTLPRQGAAFTKRLQRGPHTGRGAKPAGLVNGRTHG